MKFLFKLMAILIPFMGLVGCKPGLNFGNDVEVSGAAFDASKLAQISKLTNIVFPSGCKGVEYYYLGSGLDDALAAKIQIPNEQKEAFLKNPVFVSSKRDAPTIEIGNTKPWWHPNRLTEREDRTMQLPNSQFLEVSFGKEGPDYFVYLSWITM